MKLGILGGGQLGRMLGMAGVPLAIDPLFWEPATSACARIVGEHLCAPYDDRKALAIFASEIVACTYEFENVPSPVLAALAEKLPVYPPLAALEASQDRLNEKQLFAKLGIKTAPYAAIDSKEDLLNAVKKIGLPAILKTRRLGYDGKGQFLLREHGDIDTAWQTLGDTPSILEGFIPFSREISIIAVRAIDGEAKFYPVSENEHRQGVLFTARACPDDKQQQAAQIYAEKMLHELNYVGVLCLELFDVDGVLIANEFAPRVHNSGHWTIEGAETSQFENHLRAVAGLPLGNTDCLGFPALINLIGKLPALEKLLAIGQTHVHFYGKCERPARKLGHVTVRAADAGQREEIVAVVLQEIQDFQEMKS